MRSLRCLKARQRAERSMCFAYLQIQVFDFACFLFDMLHRLLAEAIEDLFQPGLEVEVLQSNKDYSQIKYPGAFAGWVPTKSIEILSIQPQSN